MLSCALTANNFPYLDKFKFFPRLDTAPALPASHLVYLALKKIKISLKFEKPRRLSSLTLFTRVELHAHASYIIALFSLVFSCALAASKLPYLAFFAVFLRLGTARPLGASLLVHRA